MHVPPGVKAWAHGHAVVGHGGIWTEAAIISRPAVRAADGTYVLKKFAWYLMPAVGETPVITGRRVDGVGTFHATVNNAYSDGSWWAVSTLELSTSGCWEITGQYRTSQLTFRVLVPSRAAPAALKLGAKDPGVGTATSRGLRSVTHGTFSTPSGAVLAFDDGYDGITLVDLDHRRAVRRVLDGQRAGDQLHRLTRTGDSLIVGWGEIYAVPLDGGPSRHLGTATYSVPATDSGTVWIIDLPSEGTRVGGTARLVDLQGRVLRTLALDEPALSTTPSPTPSIGVRDGLVFESARGIQIWNATTGQTRVVGNELGFVGDVHDDVLTWCGDGCPKLHIADLAGTERLIAPPRHAMSFDVRSARFSPDGKVLAVVAGPRVESGHTARGVLIFIDVSSGTRRVVARGVTMAFTNLGWSADGSQLFFSTGSYQKSSTELGRVDLRTFRVERTHLPFGGALSFVALNKGDASGLLQAANGPQEECQPPVVYPSGRSSPCAFVFKPLDG